MLVTARLRVAPEPLPHSTHESPHPAARPLVLATVATCAMLAVTVFGPLSGAAQAAEAAEVAPQQPPSVCPTALQPPPPVDTSEVPEPGSPTPEPVAVPAEPVGGPRLGDCGLITPPGVAAPPAEVTAGSWILADLDSGEVLAAHDPHARHRPASTIKVLTALLAIRELQMNDTIVATQADADQEGSRVGLIPNVTYTVEQVLTGLVLQSGNDAAHALAMKLGGLEATVAKMNELAASLGAHDTRAATPSGLDGPGMSTSSYDLAVIFRAAMRTPEFARIDGTQHIDLPGPPGQPPTPVWSDNRVILNYPGALGGKTGFTDDARHTFIAAAQRDGRRLVTVLLRGENRPVRLSAQTTKLLDYGFAMGKTEPIGALTEEKRPTTAEAAPQPRTDGAGPVQATSRSSTSGTIGGPLSLLAVAVIAIAGAFAVRARRVRLASAARRNSANGGDDHP